MDEQEHVPVGAENLEEQDSPEVSQEGGKEHHIMWIVVAFFALLVVLGVVAFYKYSKPDDAPVEPEPVSRHEPLTEDRLASCDFDSDGAAFAEAVNTANMDFCYCMEDDGQKARCKTSVSDALIYNNALASMDADRCDEMTTEEGRGACKAVVTSSIEYFEEEDPMYLADIKAGARNGDAVSDYEAILEGDPENIQALVSLAHAYAEQALFAQERGEDYMPYVESALIAINKAKDIDAENAEVYRVMGYIYEIQPDFDASLIAYNTALEKDGGNLFAYVGRGHLEKMRGMYDLALEDFEKAAALDTENKVTQIYTNLCNLELSRGNLDKGLEHCLTAISNENGDRVFRSEAYQMLAAEMMNAQDLSQALRY